MKPCPETQPVIYSHEAHLQRIYEEVQGVYGRLAVTYVRQENADALHTKGVCLEWAELAKRTADTEARMFDAGAQVHIMNYEPPTSRSTLRYHRFLRVLLTGMQQDAAVYLDGTWQQFLPEHRRTPDLPRVLWGTQNTITALAKRAGLPRSRYSVWQQATPLIANW